ncbi:MAG: reverse transcriptase domain-containing protein, partial [Cetobacterium sp.]
MIMAGKPLDYKKELAAQFGSYCQVHMHHTPRNSMKERTSGGICLGPSGNEQGGCRFLHLSTGVKITAYKWTTLPMPDNVIARVNLLGKDQPKDLTFYDRYGRPISTPDDDIQPAGVGVDLNPEQQDDDVLNIEQELQEIAQQDEVQQVEGLDPVQLQIIPQPNQTEFTDQNIETHPQMESEVDTPPTPVDNTGVRRSTRTKTQTKSSYIPSMHGKKYQTVLTQTPSAEVFDLMQIESPQVVATVMTQLSMHKGLKVWGDKAKRAVHAEMKQLHMRNTFKPKHWSSLSKDEKEKLLESHLFLKQKRCGTIKGRTVAGGNKQRGYINKQDASSPTVSTQALLLTCVVEAHEGRDIMTIDIPNAFIQTKVKDPKQRALIKIKGILVDILVDIAPHVYKEFVHTDRKGNKVIIAECMNAIYGTMVASLLYYMKFCASLKKLGFQPNPYEPCVQNRIVNGSQQTICFHVDDCKVSHIDPQVNDDLELQLRKEYEYIMEDGSGKMKVHRGKVHEYLGMTLDYTEKQVCQVSMPKFIDEVLNDFKKIMPDSKGGKTSAAPRNLFEVKETCEKL